MRGGKVLQISLLRDILPVPKPGDEFGKDITVKHLSPDFRKATDNTPSQDNPGLPGGENGPE